MKSLLKNRRRLILWAVAAAVLIAAAVWLHIGSARVVVNEQRVNLPHLAAADDGLRVAILSDPHFGPGDAGRAAMLAKKLNRMKPDLIFLLGDFVNGTPDHRRSLSPEDLAKFVASLKARHVFAVTGNHELWYGRGTVEDALREGGATVLRNRCAVVSTSSGHRLQIVGLTDYTTEEPPEKFPATAPDTPTLVLMHDAHSAEYVPEKLDCFCLAGHTHGGQLRAVPGGGDRTSLRLAAARLRDRLGMLTKYPNRPYVLFDRGFTNYHGRKIFITSGTGLSRLPVRVFCPPEVVLLQLHVADPEAAANTFTIPEEL